MAPDPSVGVMIAGIGGASLGTEIAKCLAKAGGYDVSGCDISENAFGHFSDVFRRTVVVQRGRYAESVLAACRQTGARWLIPGAEQPTSLLGAARELFDDAGVTLVANDSKVIALCTDKRRTFEALAAANIPFPRTWNLTDARGLADVAFPCVVKPATGSGGSDMVFLAADARDAELYVSLIAASGRGIVVQEYVPLDEGEFTVGVLSLPDGSVHGSIALRRVFDSKLSVRHRSEIGLISSGYSQGEIDDFPAVRAQAERIARAVGSTGPINVQGRVRGGVLLPFEINPRFSASTYLRALAGYNEVDVYLRALRGLPPGPMPAVTPGLYLRSLTEVCVPRDRK
jgi:carbamoyl-phosphate synthase large subunit